MLLDYMGLVSVIKKLVYTGGTNNIEQLKDKGINEPTTDQLKIPSTWLKKNIILFCFCKGRQGKIWKIH